MSPQLYVKSKITKILNSKGNSESPLSNGKSKAKTHQTNGKQLLCSWLVTEI